MMMNATMRIRAILAGMALAAIAACTAPPPPPPPPAQNV